MARFLESVRQFQPHAVWTEGPWCGEVAKRLCGDLDLPLLYRSHNIEHIYMPRQAAAARRLRDRLAWNIACIGLGRYESDMIHRANWVFDISQDDMAFWQARGVQRISWLPPLAETSLAQPGAPATQPEHDVVFLGNLTTPNNVRGVEWLVNDIRPLVLARRPGTRFVVAGSNPGPHVRALCQADEVELMANVPDAPALYASARVLVNPVRTGSGTHVKMIQMLMTAAPIVTTAQGTQGLPPDISSLVRVSDTAQGFADGIVDALSGPPPAAHERDAVRQLFGVDAVRDALARARSLAGPADSGQAQAHGEPVA